ncbi:DUF397 domain-containing protein [Streptomyces sparsogenes]|uniref:DUF397 domain-containing protein n=1 Tax=Streptomyces sparsogenes DSM 40356 TaxID=1331668 RepID=A0A1R1SQ15_9ACTN|nr:DUF397 domain-containing protein [Streptomyces sparsogenes]OMI40396.1 hypothetical protein SPAR_06025 [Streptomyces sparsogenes DSM 40356]
MRTALDLSGAKWVKSSYSNGHEGECVEFAPDIARISGAVPVRDSKNPNGTVLVFSVDAWDMFTVAVRSEDFPTS